MGATISEDVGSSGSGVGTTVGVGVPAVVVAGDRVEFAGAPQPIAAHSGHHHHHHHNKRHHHHHRCHHKRHCPRHVHNHVGCDECNDCAALVLVEASEQEAEELRGEVEETRAATTVCVTVPKTEPAPEPECPPTACEFYVRLSRLLQKNVDATREYLRAFAYGLPDVKLSAELLQRDQKHVADLLEAAARETHPHRAREAAARQRQLLEESLRHAGVLAQRHAVYLVLTELVATKRRLVPSAAVTREQQLMMEDRRRLSERAVADWRQTQRHLASALHEANRKHASREDLTRLLEQQVDASIKLADETFRSALARGVSLSEACRRVREGAMVHDQPTQDFAKNLFALGILPDPEHVTLQLAAPPDPSAHDAAASEHYRQLEHVLAHDLASHLAHGYAAAAAERSEI